ncbi:hypothetical protein VP01_6184g1, partial [Puccinia sorghi]
MADFRQTAAMASTNLHNGFRQAMLKTALETIPLLTEENYSIWKDKMTALLLIISKMDSVTHNNVVTADNRGLAQKMWAAIKEQFASSQASNQARIFNNFLYIKFQEDLVETCQNRPTPRYLGILSALQIPT